MLKSPRKGIRSKKSENENCENNGDETPNCLKIATKPTRLRSPCLADFGIDETTRIPPPPSRPPPTTIPAPNLLSSLPLPRDVFFFEDSLDY